MQAFVDYNGTKAGGSREAKQGVRLCVGTWSENLATRWQDTGMIHNSAAAA
jgi:hypothetical protein